MKNDDRRAAWIKQVSAAHGEVVFEIGGEVDLSTVKPLESTLTAALSANPAKVVFELRELRFMDSSGIAMLLATAQRVERVELRYPTATVRRVIELAGLSTVLPITS